MLKKIIYLRIIWIFGSNKPNRNVRTLEELLPSRNQDGYQPNPIVSTRDTYIMNTVSYIQLSFYCNYHKLFRRILTPNGNFQEVDLF